MIKYKKYKVYVLFNTETRKPIYIGCSCSLQRRIRSHQKIKKFNGVLILQSFDDKEIAYACERSIIKFLSIFPLESIVNAKYDNLTSEYVIHNLMGSILNGNHG